MIDRDLAISAILAVSLLWSSIWTLIHSAHHHILLALVAIEFVMGCVGVSLAISIATVNQEPDPRNARISGYHRLWVRFPLLFAATVFGPPSWVAAAGSLVPHVSTANADRIAGILVVGLTSFAAFADLLAQQGPAKLLVALYPAPLKGSMSLLIQIEEWCARMIGAWWIPRVAVATALSALFVVLQTQFSFKDGLPLMLSYMLLVPGWGRELTAAERNYRDAREADLRTHR